jgi:hypothetical protein
MAFELWRLSICDLSGAGANCQDSLVMTAPGGWLELEEPPVFTKVKDIFELFLSWYFFRVHLLYSRNEPQKY